LGRKQATIKGTTDFRRVHRLMNSVFVFEMRFKQNGSSKACTKKLGKG
jgi:hypothetical protein